LKALKENLWPFTWTWKEKPLSLANLLLLKLEIFSWNLQQCKKLSLTHLKLHTFNNSKTFVPHTSNFQWNKELSSTHFHLETCYLKKNLKNKFFTFEKFTTLWRNLFHTSHSLRNGLLFFLQPCKPKKKQTFPQKDSPFLCYTS
jgi:hypothetical protein